MLIFFFYIFIFILGLAVGSFLNAVIYRLEINKSVLDGRSFCPHCNHSLAWYDLIPIFSFLFLGGRCRYCRKKISIQYPLVELATGVLFITLLKYKLAYYGFEFLFNPIFIMDFIFLAIIFSFFEIIFVYDFKHYIIPDKIVFPAVIAVLFHKIFYFSFILNFFDFKLAFNFLLSSFLGALFFLAIIIFSKGKWMGFGDVKLVFLMGLLLGGKNLLVALFLAFLFGAIIGIVMILFKKKTMQSEIPFGPFLIFGTMVSFLWAERIINWYFNLFLF